MLLKFVILGFAITVCHSAPYFNAANQYSPGAVLRHSQTPSVSYGYGSGLSSNTAGISHSTGIGNSFQSGDNQAYGAGFANNDGSSNARGVGVSSANSNPYARIHYVQPAGYNAGINYNGGLRPSYGSAVSSAQNFGSISTAVAKSNTAGYGSAASSASNLRGLRYGSASSSATSNNGYGSAISTADKSGYGSAVSSAQTRGGLNDYSSAVSVAENVGGVKASTAHTFEQSGGTVQQSGANSFDGPGLQAAYSHAVNTGYH